MNGGMGLGWKVITGAVLLGLGQLFGALVTDCPVPAWIPWLKWMASGLNAAGLIFSGVGVSSKVANAVNSVTNSLSEGNHVVAKAMQEQKFIEKIIEKRVPYIVKRLGPDDELLVRTNDRQGKAAGSPDVKKE